MCECGKGGGGHSHQKEMTEERVNLLRLHGLVRRYNNVVQQEYLENASIFCSAGSLERSVGALCTVQAGRRPRVEMFCGFVPQEADDTTYELVAFLMSVKQWAGSVFKSEKLVIITKNDEVMALLNRSDLDIDIPQRKLDLAKEIRNTIAEAECQYVVICSTDNNVIRMAAEYEDSKEMGPIFDEYVKSTLDNPDINVIQVQPPKL